MLTSATAPSRSLSAASRRALRGRGPCNRPCSRALPDPGGCRTTCPSTLAQPSARIAMRQLLRFSATTERDHASYRLANDRDECGQGEPERDGQLEHAKIPNHHTQGRRRPAWFWYSCRSAESKQPAAIRRLPQGQGCRQEAEWSRPCIPALRPVEVPFTAFASTLGGIWPTDRPDQPY